MRNPESTDREAINFEAPAIEEPPFWGEVAGGGGGAAWISSMIKSYG